MQRRQTDNDPVLEARALGPSAEALTGRLDPGRVRKGDIVKNERSRLRYAPAICKPSQRGLVWTVELTEELPP